MTRRPWLYSTIKTWSIINSSKDGPITVNVFYLKYVTWWTHWTVEADRMQRWFLMLFNIYCCFCPRHWSMFILRTSIWSFFKLVEQTHVPFQLISTGKWIQTRIIIKCANLKLCLLTHCRTNWWWLKWRAYSNWLDWPYRSSPWWFPSSFSPTSGDYCFPTDYFFSSSTFTRLSLEFYYVRVMRKSTHPQITWNNKNNPYKWNKKESPKSPDSHSQEPVCRYRNPGHHPHDSLHGSGRFRFGSAGGRWPSNAHRFQHSSTRRCRHSRNRKSSFFLLKSPISVKKTNKLKLFL